MRKNFILLTGFLFCLFSLKTNGQQDILSSVNTSSFISSGIIFQDAPDISDLNKKEIAVNDESFVTCKADFEINLTPNFLLYKKFTAITGNSEQKKPVLICWKFGDGKDTCIQYSSSYNGSYNVIHLYQQPGNYEVCVRIVYDGGCEAKSCKMVEVKEPIECKADFERIGMNTNTNSLQVYYKAFPSNFINKKVKQICWKFGDGKDTCIQYPENFGDLYFVKHEYKLPGKYDVCVVVKYTDGCEAKSCKAIQVIQKEECKTDFERLPLTSVNDQLTTNFKALPFNSNNKKVKTICWKFGNGKDTCIQYPENYNEAYTVKHTYTRSGNYEVCVKITFYGGCEAYKCKLVKVVGKDECKADFEKIHEYVSNHPLLTYFKAITTHNNNKKPKQICWKFGDGKDTCITYPENYTGPYIVKHEYKDAGTYEVCEKIVYYGGCEANICKKITVIKPVECKAGFERIPENVATHPSLAYLKALAAHSENKKPKKICWTFGDGKDTCIEYLENHTGTYTVKHEYREARAYEVCVKIQYYGGCEAKKCGIVKIDGPGRCIVKIYEPLTPVIQGHEKNFGAIFYNSNNKRPLRICWNFGDGKDTCIEVNSSISLHRLFVRHKYNAPGVYKTCVKVVFDGDCVAESCVEVKVKSATNNCGGYMTNTLVSPRVIKFKGFAFNNPNDPVASYHWTFGDGSSADGMEVTHSYNEQKTYEVCLVIKTQSGCETKICKRIIVQDTDKPVLQVSPNPVVNTMKVLFYSKFTETVQIKIVNSFGVIVRNYTRNAVTGSNTWDLDLSTLNTGTYMIYVQSQNQLIGLLFIKN